MSDRPEFHWVVYGIINDKNEVELFIDSGTTDARFDDRPVYVDGDWIDPYSDDNPDLMEMDKRIYDELNGRLK